MAKVRTNLAAKAGNTAAAHVQHEDGEHSAVAIWNLSVLIVPDENFWFAQGLEINYGAQGDSEEDARKNFEQGFLATVHQHLKVHGNIERLLKFAPSQILREAARNKAAINKYYHVSFHEIADKKTQEALPFDGIEYRVIRHAA